MEITFKSCNYLLLFIPRTISFILNYKREAYLIINETLYSNILFSKTKEIRLFIDWIINFDILILLY